jgi:hypothetical protein
VRVSDDRYSRDRSRLDLALRFIRHEARTQTIRAWTGLTEDRIRKLYRSYLAAPDSTPPVRHRGKSPQQPAWFLRSPAIAQEASVLASLFCLLGVASARTVPSAPGPRPAPSVARGELLSLAYETYRELVPTPRISFEHAVFLLNSLVRASDLTLGPCDGCGALTVRDRFALDAIACACCVPPPARPSPRPRARRRTSAAGAPDTAAASP